MEISVDSQQGLTVVLACLSIGMALHFVKWIVEFFKEPISKKFEKSDQMAADLIRIEFQLESITKKLDEMSDLKKDVNHVMIGIRILAGEQWPEVQDAIIRDLFSGK